MIDSTGTIKLKRGSWWTIKNTLSTEGSSAAMAGKGFPEVGTEGRIWDLQRKSDHQRIILF